MAPTQVWALGRGQGRHTSGPGLVTVQAPVAAAAAGRGSMENSIVRVLSMKDEVLVNQTWFQNTSPAAYIVWCAAGSSLMSSYAAHR